MRLWSAFRLLLLPVICVCMCSVSARAQSTSKPGTCSPDVSSDEFKEMIGKKVYPKAVIDVITFDGPVHLPAVTLEELVTSLKQKEFDRDSKWLDEIEEMSVRAAWQDQGYYMVEVSGRALPLGGDVDHQHFSVILHVDEGLRYRVGSIQFRAVHDFEFDTNEPPSGISLRKRKEPDGDGSASPDSAALPIFPVEELRKLIPLQEGDILDAGKIREGLEAMKDLYAAHGYIDFTPVPFTDVDDEHQLVSLRFDLDEQKEFRIGKIEVIGFDANTESALIWKIKPGDPFNNDLLEAFFKDNQSILPSGASFVDSEVRRDKGTGIVNVKLSIRPCPRG